VVPLDHFATSRCGATVCHPDFAAAILRDRARQVQGVVRVTHGLDCVRMAAIEQAVEFAADPLTYMSAMSGQAWDALLAAEAGAAGQVEVTGEIDGVRVVGHIDRIAADAIEDHKRVGFLPKDKQPDDEYVAQLSVYGHFKSRRLGRLWYATHFDLLPVEFDLWPIEQVLEFKPRGGELTVRENYHLADDYFAGRIGWQQLPLTGQRMTFKSGKSLCDYCSVRSDCTVAAMGVSF
jgi:hypothetical protein